VGSLGRKPVSHTPLCPRTPGPLPREGVGRWGLAQPGVCPLLCLPCWMAKLPIGIPPSKCGDQPDEGDHGPWSHLRSFLLLPGPCYPECGSGWQASPVGGRARQLQPQGGRTSRCARRLGPRGLSGFRPAPGPAPVYFCRRAGYSPRRARSLRRANSRSCRRTAGTGPSQIQDRPGKHVASRRSKLGRLAGIETDRVSDR